MRVFSAFRLIVGLLALVLAQHVSAQDNIATQWYALEDRALAAPLAAGPVVGPNRLSAVGQARAVFLLTSAVYDAWAVYDSRAIPSTYRNERDKVPRVTGSQADLDMTISYAAYRLIQYLHAEEPTVLNQALQMMTNFGYDHSINSTDTTTPIGVGNTVAFRIIESAKKDGTNSVGDHPSSAKPGVPFSDYSNYLPINAAKTATEIREEPCKGIVALDHWTPLKNSLGVVQEFNPPFMAFVQPFALSGPTEVAMPGAPLPNTPRSDDFHEQFHTLIVYSANLTDLQKINAEYWVRLLTGDNAEIPEASFTASASGAELFFKISFDTARNLQLSLADTVKLLFAQGVAVWDSAISCWTYKRLYNTGRPVTVIPCLFENSTEDAWMGPYKGTGPIQGSHWQTYLSTPPFAEYPSGHSTFSSASAVVLRNFLGTDEYHGNPVVVQAGGSRREPKVVDPADPRYIAGVTDVANTGPGTPGYTPATNITLTWRTYTEAAQAAGLSRLHAGFHIRSGNEDGLAAGAKIGEIALAVCSSLWNPSSDESAASQMMSWLRLSYRM